MGHGAVCHSEAVKGGAAVLKGRALLPAPPSWECGNRSLIIPYPVGYVELLSVARPFLMLAVRAEGESTAAACSVAKPVLLAAAF